MKLNPNFILKQIGDSATLVPFGQALVDFNCLASFNKVGAFLAEKLQKNVSFDDLVEATTTRFKIDEETARRDVAAFVQRLRADGLLVDETTVDGAPVDEAGR